MPIRNVLVYVCDALRWDALPRAVDERGVTFKTVAQSTWSPPCFTTLSTGLYPQRHGVHKFTHQLDESVRTVYDIEGLDGVYRNKDPNDRLADVFGVDQHRTLADVSPPFFYLERDLATHAPYDQREPTDQAVYFDEVDHDWDRIRADYYDGVEISLDIFEQRLATLRERGLLDETLVIFTGDHGEILGEYGDIAHSNPTCPEVVYVPAVFIHPSLSADDFQVDPQTEIVEQVDLVETALSAIGFDDLATDGVDVLAQPRGGSPGYNYVRVAKRGISFYETESAWDRDGGYVFPTNARAARIAYFLYRQLRGTHRHLLRDDWRRVLTQYVHDSYEYGEPNFSAQSARQFVDETTDRIETREPTETTITEETEEQLKNMGYRV